VKDGDHIAEYPAGHVPRRAVDWSKVMWITETSGGYATLIFDKDVDNTNWATIDATFDKAVADWKRYKYDADRKERRKWWRCW